MTEEQLASKSIEDLRAIAATMGFMSEGDAAGKSKDEIISVITGRPVEKVPKAKKAPAKKPAAKKTTTKKTAKSEDAKPAEVVEEKVEEPKAEETAAEPKKTSKKSPVKKTTKKTTKTEQPAPAETVEVADADVAPEAAPEVVAEEAPKAKKTTKKSPKSKKAADKPEEKAEVVAEEKSDVVEVAAPASEAKAEDKKSSKRPRRKGAKKDDAPIAETVSEDTKPAEAPAETAQTEAAEPQPVKKPEGKKNSKRRKISFGPGQETKEVEVTAEETAAVEPPPPPPEPVYTPIEGVLSIGGERNDFCGFVHKTNYLPGEEDAYVPGQMIKRLGLRRGDYIVGLCAEPKGKEKYSPLRKIISVNGIELPEDTTDWDVLRKRPRFEQLTAIYPDERLTLETGAEDLSCRIIDLFCPIGKGQRGMIVSPPKAGKTILMQRIANAITANNPEAKVMVLLIDERPEEVTDMQRHIKGEVAYSTFDKRPENHVRLTELVLERAMRLVELGQDVIILLDSMTRLGRAYNLTVAPSGRTLSGGLDPASLYGPKRFFGAARNIENGGSLTIIATALIETGSKMDEVIFEEFKGTGNMEVVLDRKLADRRVYPAIAVDKSGTRREDLLLTPEEMDSVWLTRKAIADVDTITATEAVLNFMKKTPSNRSFVLSAKKSFDVN